MTTPSTRKKKPAPVRTQPLRSVSKVLRAAPRRAEPASVADAPFMPLIERTVRTGYELVEEYLQAGRRAADSLRPKPSEPLGSARAGEPLPARFSEYSTQLVMAGLEYLQTLSREGPLSAQRSAPKGEAPPFEHLSRPRTPAAVSGTAPRRVQISVLAQMPVQVTVELSAEAGSGALAAQAARYKGPRRGSSIERGITLAVSCTQKVIKLRAHVDKSVAPGSYRSLLVRDDDNLPCGQVTLQVPVRKVK